MRTSEVSLRIRFSIISVISLIKSFKVCIASRKHTLRGGFSDAYTIEFSFTVMPVKISITDRAAIWRTGSSFSWPYFLVRIVCKNCDIRTTKRIIIFICRAVTILRFNDNLSIQYISSCVCLLLRGKKRLRISSSEGYGKSSYISPIHRTSMIGEMRSN